MKKTVTLGELLSIITIVVMSMIGWGVTIEVRMATEKAKEELTRETKRDVKEIKADVKDLGNDFKELLDRISNLEGRLDD